MADPPSIQIGERTVGPGHPVYVVAEIGINHNGDVALAEKLIDAAVFAGCDAVKFQKRTPEVCVPRDQWDRQRDTPWGVMSYLDYKHRIELDVADYQRIDAYCDDRGIDWFVSCWDRESLAAMGPFDLPAYKIASACLTDEELLAAHVEEGRPLLMSTGMSTLAQIDRAVEVTAELPRALAHCTSSYPCSAEELNLRMIHTLVDRYSLPVGYSGHEVGLQATIAAVALGACFVERHLTLDRAMWGTDQAASVEPMGFFRLVRDIRVVETALGDGVKQVYDSELPVMAKLRRIQG